MRRLPPLIISGNPAGGSRVAVRVNGAVSEMIGLQRELAAETGRTPGFAGRKGPTAHAGGAAAGRPGTAPRCGNALPTAPGCGGRRRRWPRTTTPRCLPGCTMPFIPTAVS